ncbi:Ca(2+)-dependent cysteine protease [Perkinsus chesapeaki]|uniref:Ca(2+)-dependent cysteine protease n=1 Tax=Perkinsus chesapeaki TaxID=330153 RepID=A0A7J6MYS1_PERCH|nr:Ca(2+)-dependent cysteine protease [Perkinsus chesapeaki]
MLPIDIGVTKVNPLYPSTNSEPCICVVVSYQQAPQVATGNSAPLQATVVQPREVTRTAQVQCGSCHQVLTVQMTAMRDQSVKAQATCPHCQMLNEFMIPPETVPTATAMPMSGGGGLPQQAPPPSMQSQAMYGLPSTMQMQQTSQVGMPTPSLTGVQRALLIGINYYNTPAQLSGCIPDAHNMFRLLTETYRWNPGDIRMMTDDGRAEMPTRANIIAALHWLVRDAKPGDVFFFHYSGHGSQQTDPYGLEEDGMNETILPCDAWIYPGAGLREEAGKKRRIHGIHSAIGCDDAGTSADASAGSMRGGAMTTAFCNSIRASPYITYIDLIHRLNDEMRRHRMGQRPQLSSTQVFPVTRPFNLTDILPNQNQYIGRIVRKRFKPRKNKKKMQGLDGLLLPLAGGMLAGALLGSIFD